MSVWQAWEWIHVTAKLYKSASIAFSLVGGLAVLFVVPVGQENQSMLHQWVSVDVPFEPETGSHPGPFGMTGIESKTEWIRQIPAAEAIDGKNQVRMAKRLPSSVESLLSVDFEPVGNRMREERTLHSIR